MVRGDVGVVKCYLVNFVGNGRIYQATRRLVLGTLGNQMGQILLKNTLKDSDSESVLINWLRRVQQEAYISSGFA